MILSLQFQILFFLKRISFKNKNDEAGAGPNDKIHLKFPKWILKTGLHHTKGCDTEMKNM